MTATTRAEGTQRLVILGAGAFAQELAELAADAGFEVIAFVEGIDRAKCAHAFAGRPVVWIDEIRTLAGSHAICAVGSVDRGGLIAAALTAGLQFTSLVHPRAHVSPSSAIGMGSLVGAGTIIGAQSRIESHVLVNRGCLLGHHVRIGELSTISPGTNIGGHARIGRKCYIGMGAIVLDRIEVGDGAVVGAGAVVTQDVPSCVEVLGIPARVSRQL